MTRAIASGYSIRSYTPADQAGFKAVMLEVLAESGFSYDPELNFDLDHPELVYLTGQGTAWIVEYDGRIVGTVGVQDLGNGVGYGRRLALLRQHRRAGIGRHLLEIVSDYFFRAGFSIARIDTLESAGMYTVYMRYGYQIVERVPEGSDTKLIMERRQPIRQVQAVILRPHGSTIQVLILKRAPSDNGFWQPITGAVQPGEDFIGAAYREVTEESGFAPPSIVMHDTGYVFGFSIGSQQAVEHVFVGIVGPDAQSRLSAEHISSLWLPLDESLDCLRYSSNRTSVQHAVAWARQHLTI